MYYIRPRLRPCTSALIRKGLKESHESHQPNQARRHTRAVWNRPAPDTRLLPSPSFNTVSLGFPLPSDGRSFDCRRHSPSKGLCRYIAPSSGRLLLADFTLAEDISASFDAFARALVPLSGSTTRCNWRFPFGPPRHRVVMPSHAAVERCRRTDNPHPETPSTSVCLLRHAWGYRRTAADATSVGAGVVVFLLTSPGPSIASPSFAPFPGSARNLGLAHSPISALPATQPKSGGEAPPPPPTKGTRLSAHIPHSPNRAAKENVPFPKQSKFVPLTEIQSNPPSGQPPPKETAC